MPELRNLLTTLAALARQRQLALYLVGGVLRDYWGTARSATPRNLDFAVPRDSLSLARVFANEAHGTLVVLDASLGAARVVVEAGTQRYEFDLNDFRAPALEGDLAKRDFTLNAMALRVDDLLRGAVEESALIDPLGGLRDRAQGILRATAAEAFRDDPVRIVRGVSLAARYGWSIEDATQHWMRDAVASLPQVAGERLRDELFKLLATGDAATYLRQLDALGALQVLLPELEACRGTNQGPYHHLDVWAHSMETVVQFEALLREAAYPEALRPALQAYLAEPLAGDRTRQPLLKLVALLHDIGKPSTRTVDETGRLWFTGHEHVGAEMAKGIAERFKLSARERDAMQRHIAAHLRPGFLSRERVITPRAIYRFFRDTQQEGPGVLLVWLADRLATTGPQTLPEEIPQQRAIIQQLLEAYFVQPEQSVQPPRLVTGHDLMQALGLPPGPKIGELLDAIAEAQVERTVATRDEAVTFAQQLLRSSRATDSKSA